MSYEVQNYYEVQGSPADESHWLAVYEPRYATLAEAQRKLRESLKGPRFPRPFRYRIVHVRVFYEVIEQQSEVAAEETL